MALYDEGMLCPLCHSAMGRGDVFGFTFLGSAHPLIQVLDDQVCHHSCLNRWVSRDNFVISWNREAKYRLGLTGMLDITRSGEVRYLTWVDKLAYYQGFKKSRWLPERIQRDHPLLVMKLVNSSESTGLWLQTQYGGGTRYPSPEAVGLCAETCAAIRDWVARYASHCVRSRQESRPAPEGWNSLGETGRQLWKVVSREIGNRYRVVYVGQGQVFEPEDLPASDSTSQS